MFGRNVSLDFGGVLIEERGLRNRNQECTWLFEPLSSETEAWWFVEKNMGTGTVLVTSGWLKNRNLLLKVFEAGMSRILVSGAVPYPGLRGQLLIPFSYNVLTVCQCLWREQGGSLVSPPTCARIPLDQGPTFIASFNLNYSLLVFISKYSHTGG
jgi:hypothetical protein